jgi:hypothetical protein
MNDALIKRVVTIGAELVALEAQRNEIDDKMKRLMQEAHRLTRPRGDPLKAEAGEVVVPPVVNGAAYLVRNNEPTVRSRLLRLLGERHGVAVTKWEAAETLKLTPTQAQNGLVDLKKRNIVDRVGPSQYALTERGQASFEQLPADGKALPSAMEGPVGAVPG